MKGLLKVTCFVVNIAAALFAGKLLAEAYNAYIAKNYYDVD